MQSSDYPMCKVQGSVLRYTQSAEFRITLRAECSVQISLRAKCRVQDYATYRMQGSRVRYVQCRVQNYTTNNVQGLGLSYIQNAGFRSALCTECRVQNYAPNNVQSS